MADPAETSALPEVQAGDSNWAIAYRQFRRDKIAMVGVVLVLLLGGIAVFAPLLANGRPLYIRGYLTHFYDSDAAAFSDWHARYADTVLQLRAGTAQRDRALYESRWARYKDGLPQVLARLEGNLPSTQRKTLGDLARRYGAQLAATPEAVDLDALDAIGRDIETRFCALSLTSAYKRAAGPLLEVPDLLDAVRDAQELLEEPGEAERDQALATLRRVGERGVELARMVEEGTLAVLTFLEEEQRAELNSRTRDGLAALRELAGSDRDLGAIGARVEALAGLLDEIGNRRVDPARQQLPLVTRWPVIEHLGADEVLFIVLYVCLLIDLALWRWLPDFEFGWASIVLPACIAAALWHGLVPDHKPPSESGYKDFARQLDAHPDGVSSIIFPIVPHGENENIHADRATAPAIWERIGPKVQQENLARRLQEPGKPPQKPERAIEDLTRLRSHWLGTDDNGRDVLARLIYGSRVSLSVGFVAVGIYVLIGVILGSLAGYFGGWVDALLMRITEVVMCMPALMLIITVMSIVIRPSIFHVMVIIGITRWTEIMRLVRGEFLRLNAMDFVTAAEAQGLHPLRVVFRHMLPNAFGPVFVSATFGVAGAILIESALSYLGFGVPQPTASWGSVLNVSFGKEKELWCVCERAVG